MDYSTTKINLLDLTVTKVGNKLETYSCCKPTDTHQYLQPQLCHRNMHKKSIAYGKAVRIKRTISTKENLNNRLEQLNQWLVNRRCKEDHVDREIERVNLVDRTVLFQRRNKKVDNNITLVLIYHPALNQVYETLRRTLKHVPKSPRLHSALPLSPWVAFRNAKTIKHKLVRSKLKKLFVKMLASIFVIILTAIRVEF